MNILIVDDDHGLCRSLQLHLQREGHTVTAVQRAGDGIAKASAQEFQLAFLDLNLPDMNGIELLRRMRDISPLCFHVMITGAQDSKATIEAVRLGAFDYLRKPLDLDDVLLTVERVRQQQQRSRVDDGATPVYGETTPAHEIIGAHTSIIQVLKQVAIFGGSRVPVLIQGESGTGKELVARALHEAGSAGRAFVAVNCSAVVSTLLESELFGHVKGAFTGADSDKPGKLEVAGEGTVFFDEIGDMAADLQAKLLRVLQEREFERVGGTKTMAFRARVIAATHRDLQELMRDGRFREDLYYRLAVSTIRVPPLRERRTDIPLLVERLLGRLSHELHKSVQGIEPQALELLQRYDWPGNVREMVNVLTRLVLIARGPVISAEEVRYSMGAPQVREAQPEAIKSLSEVEREHIQHVLQQTGWNITHAADALEISRVTLRKKMQEYEIKRPQVL